MAKKQKAPAQSSTQPPRPPRPPRPPGPVPPKSRFYGSQVWNSRHAAVGEGLEVIGTLFVVFPRGQRYEKDWRTLVPKVGLLIERDERAEFSLGRSTKRPPARLTAYRALPAFVSELDAFFAPEPATRWVGFAPEEAGLVEPSFPQPQVAAWTVRLWLAPRPKPHRLVPFVLKNWRTPFSDMHVTGLWVLPGP